MHVNWCAFIGLAYPPLYFYNGGVKEFLATIKQHVFLVRLVIHSSNYVPVIVYLELMFT